MSNSKLLTTAGANLLNAELEKLKNIERPAVIQDIAEARSHGDLRENSEYAAAKEKQVLIEGRINEIERIFSTVEIFDPINVLNKKEIRFGATCLLINEKMNKELKIQIVSAFEANFDKALISIEAPFAKGLLGKEEGETAEISMAGKMQEFKIVKVSYE